MSNDRNRTKTRIASFLIGWKDQQILLQKRKNTLHMDGYWGIPSGHVFEGESCSQALIREAKEECNLVLTNDGISLVGAVHHYSHPFDYTNYVFTVDLTDHTPVNNEPDKCEELRFFNIDELPESIVPYVEHMIDMTVENSNEPWISEYGWDTK